jgi:hypothetical protein
LSRMNSESKENNVEETRQQKRARKLRKKKERMKQHGKGLAKMYRDAIEKRGKRNPVDKRKKK